MTICKNYQSDQNVKSGFVRGKQRYKCKGCGINFVIGDARTNEKIVSKKAMGVILYSLGKASYNMLANVFDTWPSLVCRWIVEAGAKLPEQEISGEIKHMEFDEMWHFVKSKRYWKMRKRRRIMQTGQPRLLAAAAKVLSPETMMEIRGQQSINRFDWAILDRWAMNSPEKLKALEADSGLTWLLMKILE